MANESFLVIGLTFICFTITLFAALLYVKEPMKKLYLSLPFLLMLMSTFFFNLQFLKITNASETALIKVAESFFIGTVVLLAPAIIIVFVIIVWHLIQKFIMRKREANNKGWQEW